MTFDNTRRWPSWTPTRDDPTPTRRVLLFEFTSHEHLYQCELLDHGVLGVGAQFTKNGEFLEGRLFETMKLAALWAGEQRKAIENSGVDPQ